MGKDEQSVADRIQRQETDLARLRDQAVKLRERLEVCMSTVAGFDKQQAEMEAAKRKAILNQSGVREAITALDTLARDAGLARETAAVLEGEIEATAKQIEIGERALATLQQEHLGVLYEEQAALYNCEAAKLIPIVKRLREIVRGFDSPNHFNCVGKIIEELPRARPFEENDSSLRAKFLFHWTFED